LPRRRTKSQVPFDLVPLRERLGVSKTVIYLWQRGARRPPAGALLKIAELLNRPLHEIVEIFWKEKLGARGKCGCGITVFPYDNPKARTLLIEISCTHCGNKRITRAGSHRNHRKLCQTCAHLAELIPFTCDGYPDHDATRWSKPCLKRGKKEWKTCEEVSRLQRQRIHRNGTSFLDVSSRKYRCRECNGANQLQVKNMEERLRKFEAEKYPQANTKILGRMRSREARLKRNILAT
jgi:hypothetical protein